MTNVEVALAEIKKDIAALQNDVTTIKSNHLVHLDQKVDDLISWQAEEQGANKLRTRIYVGLVGVAAIAGLVIQTYTAFRVK